MRERPSDLENEREILNLFCAKWGCQWVKLGNGGKYRIDAALKQGDQLKAFVEVKDYSGNFCGMNLPKYIEGCELAQWTGVPFLFVMRRGDVISHMKLHDGLTTMIPPAFRVTGGTPAGRAPLPDDIEPMAIFDRMFENPL